MRDQIEDLVMQAVTRAFGTMLNLEIAAEPSSGGLRTDEPHVAGSVGFIGQLSGIVYLYVSASFAQRATNRLLGLSEEEVAGDEMVNDAVGELTNMVVGQIKSQLSDRGMPCVLTIPSIVRGTHFVVDSVSNTSRNFKTFRCEDERLAVETLIKVS